MKLVTIKFMSDRQTIATKTGVLDAELGTIIAGECLVFARGRVHIDMVYVEGLPSRSAGKVQREVRAHHRLVSGVEIVAQ